MKISISDLKNVFQDVINGKISREDADRWAYSIIQKSEVDELEFFPATDKEIIWDGIMYLYGVDIREQPDEYLHSLENIKEAFNKLDLPGR